MTAWLKKFAKGCVPIAAALLVLSIPKRRAGVVEIIGLFALPAAILWFGRTWIRQTLIARLLALFVWVLVGFVLAIGALQLAIELSAPLFILAAAGFVYLCYDLMFRQPQLGKVRRESRD
jgi:hypothetical protein